MFERLLKLLNNSSSKYYNYPVSSIIVCDNNRTFEGVNVEVSSPNAGICAERNALFNAITNGIKKSEIKEIHVMSNSGVFPCFVCRAALVDYCNLDTKIFIYNKSGFIKTVLLSELCSHSFSDGDLI